MSVFDWKARISTRSAVCGSKPCVKGTRIWVSLVLDFLASGMPAEVILREYPQLKIDDVQACIAYGAELARERFIPIAVKE